MASKYLIRRVIASEFTYPLVAVAQTNLRRYRSQTQRRRDIRVGLLRRDYAFAPPEPTVLFKYDPFEGKVMAAF